MEGFYSGTKIKKRTGVSSARGWLFSSLRCHIDMIILLFGLQELLQAEEENTDTEEESEEEFYEEEESRRGSIVEGFSIEDSQ